MLLPTGPTQGIVGIGRGRVRYEDESRGLFFNAVRTGSYNMLSVAGRREVSTGCVMEIDLCVIGLFPPCGPNRGANGAASLFHLTVHRLPSSKTQYQFRLSLS